MGSFTCLLQTEVLLFLFLVCHMRQEDVPKEESARQVQDLVLCYQANPTLTCKGINLKLIT